MKIIKLNFGRKDSLIPPQLIELVNHCVKGRRVDIGRIELHDDFTLFEIDKAEAGRVMDSMNSFEVDGKAIVVRPAAENIRRDKKHKRAIEKRRKSFNETGKKQRK